MSVTAHMLSSLTDAASTDTYTLSLHDALPIFDGRVGGSAGTAPRVGRREGGRLIGDVCHAFAGGRAGVCSPERIRKSMPPNSDRKSTRLNSSHSQISYAVFCLKKKNTTLPQQF